MDWLDDWLDGACGSMAADAAVRLRQERWLIGRLGTAAAAIVAVPACFAVGLPAGALDGLAAAALAAPLAAVAVLLRGGGLLAAQAVAAVGFALAAVRCGPALSSFLLLAAIPLEAALCGGRHGVLAASAVALMGLAAVLLLPGGGADGAILAPAVLACLFGHAIAALVTDRRLSRLVAATGEARNAEALRAIDDLVTWHRRDGAVEAASGRLSGIPVATLAGRGLFERLLIGDRPAYLRAMGDVAASGRTHSAILHLADASEDPRGGQVRTVEMRIHRLSGCGADARLVAVTRDVEAHVRRADDLAAQLRKAEAGAAAGDARLTCAARELRGSLEAIVGYADLLMAGRGSGVEYPAIIRQTARHLAGIVATILDLESLAEGRTALAPEPLDVARLCAAASTAAAGPAERAGVTIAVEVAADLPPLAADPAACRRILDTLLADAIAFTPRGGRVMLSVRCERGKLLVSVRDTGLKVASRDLSRLGPAFRSGVGNSSLREAPLSLARGLAALHGGSLALASTPGDGFCATLALPLTVTTPLRPGRPAAERRISLRA